MKTRSSLGLTILFSAAASGSALALTPLWANPGTGPWNEPSNWDIGLPVAGDTPSINNGGTATIDNSMAIAVSLTAVGGAAGTTGNLEVTGGRLTVASDLRIGGSAASGTGVLTLSGGLVTMNPGNFNIGFGPTAGGANGTVNFPLTWTSGTTGTYRVQRSTDLQAWITVSDNVPGQAGTTSFTETNIPADAVARYYRVVRLSP